MQAVGGASTSGRQQNGTHGSAPSLRRAVVLVVTLTLAHPTRLFCLACATARSTAEDEEDEEMEDADGAGRSGLHDPPPLVRIALNPKGTAQAGKPQQKRRKGVHEKH